MIFEMSLSKFGLLIPERKTAKGRSVSQKEYVARGVLTNASSRTSDFFPYRWLLFYGHLCAHGRLNGPSDLQKVMRWSQRWNNLQICSRRDLNPGGSDLWSNTLPLDNGGALFLSFFPYKNKWSVTCPTWQVTKKVNVEVCYALLLKQLWQFWYSTLHQHSAFFTSR